MRPLVKYAQNKTSVDGNVHNFRLQAGLGAGGARHDTEQQQESDLLHHDLLTMSPGEVNSQVRSRKAARCSFFRSPE